jgi:hypothetical protein
MATMTNTYGCVGHTTAWFTTSPVELVAESQARKAAESARKPVVRRKRNGEIVKIDTKR